MSGPFGGADTPDEHAATCPSCARAVKEREAAEGKRCSGCLALFDNEYPTPSEENPTLCDGCLRIAKYRAEPSEPRGAMYGAGRYRP